MHMQKSQNTVAVFGGSAFVRGENEYEAACSLGASLVHAGFSVITGGYSGLMGAVSCGASGAGGRVQAITLSARGLPNEFVAQHHCVENLYERQQHLIERADACIAIRV